MRAPANLQIRASLSVRSATTPGFVNAANGKLTSFRARREQLEMLFEREGEPAGLQESTMARIGAVYSAINWQYSPEQSGLTGCQCERFPMTASAP